MPQTTVLDASDIDEVPASELVVKQKDTKPQKPGLIEGTREMLSSRIKELQGEAQHQTNLAMGPEAKGPYLTRLGHRLLSLAPETAAVLDKVAQGALDPKTAVGMVAGVVDPALAGAYFGTLGLQQAKESGTAPKEQRYTLDNIQNFLLGLSMATGASAAAEVPSSGRAVEGPVKLAKGAPELLQRGTQIAAGVGPEATTKPMMEEFKAKSAEAAAKEGERTAAHAAREQATQQINQGSRQLGDDIKQLDSKVRQEGNAKYDAVRQATKDDPGVPLAELSNEARTAEKMLKGSPEQIKQFRDLIRKAPEAGGVQTSAGFTQPGDPLYDQLVAEGAIDQGGNIKFDDLQGYSSEIGAKLATGNLPGDVYQALKYLKEKIDGDKAIIAERNGAGPLLKDADAYWRKYMETFYDKPSAVAATLQRVGKLDPQHYAEPFLKGKAANRGVEALAHYDPELAKRAKALQVQYEDLQKTPKASLRPIKQPETPTVEDVRARKAKEVHRAAREISRLSRYDAAVLGSSAVGPFLGHWETLLIDPAYVGIRKAIGHALDRPAVVRWLSEPSLEDLRILQGLPETVQTDVKANLRNFVQEEQAHGRPVTVSRQVGRWLGKTGAKLAAQGREILGSEEGSLNLGREQPAVNTQAATDWHNEAMRMAKEKLGPKAPIGEVLQEAARIQQAGRPTNVRAGEMSGKTDLPGGSAQAPVPPEELQAMKERIQFLKERLSKPADMQQRVRDQQDLEDLEKRLENPRARLLSRGREIVAPD